MELPARTLIFSFGSGVTFGPEGRGTAGGRSVTPCQGVFLIRCLLARFLCLGTVELLARTLLFSFGSGVTFGPGRGTAGGCFVTPCQGVFLIRRVSSGLLFAPGTVELPARTLIFSFGSGVTFGPGRGTAGGRSLIRRVSCGLVSAPGTVELPARSLIFSFGSGVTLGPGRGTAGVFWLALCALEQWNCLAFGSGATFAFRHAVSGVLPTVGPGRGTAGGCSGRARVFS